MKNNKNITHQLLNWKWAGPVDKGGKIRSAEMSLHCSEFQYFTGISIQANHTKD